MGKNVLERLDERKLMIVSFEGRNDRLIFDSSLEIESLRSDLATMREKCEELEMILRGEQAIEGAFGRTRLWGALDTVLDAKATEDELDQVMRLLNANSEGIAAARSGQSESDLKPPIPHGNCVEDLHYTAAFGVLPFTEGDEMPEDAIRRLRDGVERVPEKGWVVVTLDEKTWNATNNGDVLGPFDTREQAVSATFKEGPVDDGVEIGERREVRE